MGACVSKKNSGTKSVNTPPDTRQQAFTMPSQAHLHGSLKTSAPWQPATSTAYHHTIDAKSVPLGSVCAEGEAQNNQQDGANGGAGAGAHTSKAGAVPSQQEVFKKYLQKQFSIPFVPSVEDYIAFAGGAGGGGGGGAGGGGAARSGTPPPPQPAPQQNALPSTGTPVRDAPATHECVQRATTTTARSALRREACVNGACRCDDSQRSATPHASALVNSTVFSTIAQQRLMKRYCITEEFYAKRREYMNANGISRAEYDKIPAPQLKSTARSTIKTRRKIIFRLMQNVSHDIVSSINVDLNQPSAHLPQPQPQQLQNANIIPFMPNFTVTGQA